MTQQDYEQGLLALALWREARGEPYDTKRAVGWSIRNRVMHPSWWGTDWVSVLTKPEQYSSMTNGGDPNLVKWPLATDTSWMACMDIASEVYAGGVDAAQGCTNYYSGSVVPAWAAELDHVFDSGAFHFYK